MGILNEHHSFTGMQRDLDISKQPSSYLYDAKNIRLTVRNVNNDTLLAVVNERGTKRCFKNISTTPNTILPRPLDIKGVYLGHCKLNQYLILFTVEIEQPENTAEQWKPDHIIVLQLDTNDLVKMYEYNGNLNFNVLYPIDAISSFENKDIQKVYWTDGYNQPRFVNIMRIINNDLSLNDNSFDFVQELALTENVTVTKKDGAGEFPAGVIQYCITYYTKYGQETNIAYTTHIKCIAHNDRGAAPDEKLSCGFEITITGVDTQFEYLRIYSLLRTSLNGTPIAKRVRDIKINGNSTISYLDNGLEGDSIDPTELLYKGGDVFSAKTLTQKDNTLFFGSIRQDYLEDFLDLKEAFEHANKILYTSNGFIPRNMVNYNFDYSFDIDASTFKYGEYYKIGVQFQHKSGIWTDPIPIDGNLIIDKKNYYNTNGVNYNYFKVIINLNIDFNYSDLNKVNKFKRARLLMVVPNNSERKILCQGIMCPTVFNPRTRYTLSDTGFLNVEKEGGIYAQSSWLFRPYAGQRQTEIEVLPPIGTTDDFSPYIQTNLYNTASAPLNDTIVLNSNPINTIARPNFRNVEIGIKLHNENNPIDYRFNIDNNIQNVYSPELVFNEDLFNFDFNSVFVYSIGKVNFNHTYGDISIQTSSPTIGEATGVEEKSVSTVGNAALISGLYYSDFLVDDRSSKYEPYSRWKFPTMFPVFMWHPSGSLNNDVQREGRSSVLEKKKISNYHICNTIIGNAYVSPDYINTNYIMGNNIASFYQDDVSITKVKNSEGTKSYNYMGNIDTLITPLGQEHVYMTQWIEPSDSTSTSQHDDCINRLGTVDPTNTSILTKGREVYDTTSNQWNPTGNVDIGESGGLYYKKNNVRMKYKSTPHIVFQTAPNKPVISVDLNTTPYLYLTDIVKGVCTPYSKDIRSYTWIPISNPYKINIDTVDVGEESIWCYMSSSWGDTYYQQFECLKTYAFSPEDENQVVEIASFPVESHFNLDGRYDRNRNQASNLNASPKNFNLFNPVYSQLDNFFSYRIMDDDYYKVSEYPNQIAWTKEKKAGAETDAWADINLASTYDMDGSKGEITALRTWKDNIFCFQNKAISNILFNSRVQIPTSDGVPIEITNNYKVDGYRIILDGNGAEGFRTLQVTPSGIYFLDTLNRYLYQIGEGINDITTTHNMCSHFKNVYYNKLLYDNINNDLYIVPTSEPDPDYAKIGALCYSERLGQFVSFYDYCNLELMESNNSIVYTLRYNGEDIDDQYLRLYSMFTGGYNDFFGDYHEEYNPNGHHKYKPWEFTFVSNGLDNNTQDFDKIFTNIDLRLDVYSNEDILHNNFPTKLRVFNEYQDTEEVSIERLSNSELPRSYHNKNTNLQKKFRVWRLQIPRDSTNIRDRIRNTWSKITIKDDSENNLKTVIHDLNVQYYI